MNNPPYPSVKEFVDVIKGRKLNYQTPHHSETPAVSIISPFYNDHDYFEESYHSVMTQTFQNFEWILVDDCSTDPNSQRLFRSLDARSAKIKTIQQSINQGPAAARNKAVTLAKGKYLFFMDTDDLIEPTYIEKCVLFLELNPQFSIVNSYSVGFEAEEYWWNQGFNTPSRFIHENLVTGRLLYKKADFERVGGYDESLRYGEDWVLWLKAFKDGQKAYTLPEYLDFYRRTNSGLLGSVRQDNSKVERIEQIIKSQFVDFFAEQTLPDVILERSIFDGSKLKHAITVENSIHESNARKRVLCIIPHLRLGGSDKFNVDLFSGLQADGYDITIATILKAEHNWFATFYAITPDIFNLADLFHYGDWLSFFRYIIQSRNIDVVFISNAYHAYHFLPILRNEFPQVAFVDYVHTEDPDWRQGGYPRISCQFSDYLDHQLVTSDYLANYYLTNFRDDIRQKLKVCHINVNTHKWIHDPDKGRKIRKRLSIHESTTVLLFPARITAQKRPLFLVDIIEEFIKHDSDIKVITLGRGDLFDAMQAKVAQKQLEPFFELLPFVSPDEMIDFYSAADILFLPSAYEGISLAIYEAMSMGLPIIAADVGGQRELVTPEVGTLIPKGQCDPDEIQQYINALLQLIHNKDYREKMGKNARKRVVEYFSLDIMVQNIKTIFNYAIQTRRETNKPHTCHRSVSEEMLLWIQEFLAVEEVWHEFQRQNQELNELRKWAEHLEKERDVHRASSLAWQRVAKAKQVELNQSRQLANPSVKQLT